jgi:hypothetical protein
VRRTHYTRRAVRSRPVFLYREFFNEKFSFHETRSILSREFSHVMRHQERCFTLLHDFHVSYIALKGQRSRRLRLQ